MKAYQVECSNCGDVVGGVNAFVMIKVDSAKYTIEYEGEPLCTKCKNRVLSLIERMFD